jgi:hypothetical protein
MKQGGLPRVGGVGRKSPAGLDEIVHNPTSRREKRLVLGAGVVMVTGCPAVPEGTLSVMFAFP